VKQLQFRVLTVAIAAYGFQFYTSGVFRTANTYINHGVTLVGYNPVNRSYLIKNSWGTTWGDVGYGYID
jgi:C1A family cysteine protease